MIHHQNGDAMGLAIAKHYPPSPRRHSEYFQGGKCLAEALWLDFDGELWLRQNHCKIVGKNNKSGFCKTYFVTACCIFFEANFCFLVTCSLFSIICNNKHETLGRCSVIG
jgi:hypothetical protein